ncbi:MAG: hypothetical protein ACD_57C00142G0004 [uncultured bacterium]|nr:MAG: hypothetical protein ACD_57C00142G0004 [uncultured bacterium]
MIPEEILARLLYCRIVKIHLAPLSAGAGKV